MKCQELIGATWTASSIDQSIALDVRTAIEQVGGACIGTIRPWFDVNVTTLIFPTNEDGCHNSELQSNYDPLADAE